MEIAITIHDGMEIEGVGVLRLGMPEQEMLSLLGKSDSVHKGRHTFPRFGCFIDVKSDSPDAAPVVDAVEFWNDGKANVAGVKLFDVDVLRTPAPWVKALLESRNGAGPVDGWFVNLDVLESGGNPKYAFDEIERNRVEGTFENAKALLLEDLEKAMYFTSFGFARKGYCATGLAELERIANG